LFVTNVIIILSFSLLIHTVLIFIGKMFLGNQCLEYKQNQNITFLIGHVLWFFCTSFQHLSSRHLMYEKVPQREYKDAERMRKSIDENEW